MPQLGGYIRLAVKAFPILVIRGQSGRQNLEGVTARQPRVLRQIDLTHPPGPQQPHDGVPGKEVSLG
jgi:hypothetical protein